MREYVFGGIMFRDRFPDGLKYPVQPDEFYLYGSPPKLGHMPATADGPSRGEFQIVLPMALDQFPGQAQIEDDMRLGLGPFRRTA